MFPNWKSFLWKPDIILWGGLQKHSHGYTDNTIPLQTSRLRALISWNVHFGNKQSSSWRSSCPRLVSSSAAAANIHPKTQKESAAAAVANIKFENFGQRLQAIVMSTTKEGILKKELHFQKNIISYMLSVVRRQEIIGIHGIHAPGLDHTWARAGIL